MQLKCLHIWSRWVPVWIAVSLQCTSSLAQQKALFNLQEARNAYNLSQEARCSAYLRKNLNHDSVKTNANEVVDTYKLIIELNDELPKEDLPDDTTCMRKMLHKAPNLFLQDGNQKSRGGWLSLEPDDDRLVELHRHFSVLPVRFGFEGGATLSVPKLDSARPVTPTPVIQKDYSGMAGYFWRAYAQVHLARGWSMEIRFQESQLAFSRTTSPADSVVIHWDQVSTRQGFGGAFGYEWSTFTGGHSGPNGIKFFVNPSAGFSANKVTYGALRLVRDDLTSDISITTDSLISTDTFSLQNQYEINMGCRAGLLIGGVSPYVCFGASLGLTHWADPNFKGDLLEMELIFLSRPDLFRVHAVHLGFGVTVTPFVLVKKRR